ncbi:MAG: hypothetical protein JO036_09115 [Candidatus Eremiobacteraeota bacterium]|nr:hypothetical protein [Candidatus Eremiobacteraeota bacterium]
MMRSPLFVVPLALAFIAATPPPPVKVPLLPQHGSKMSGTATLAHRMVKPPVVDVAIVLDGVFIPENRYPAGVYTGTCAKLSAEPAYELKPVVGGRSDTVVKVNPPKPGPYVIAVLNTAGTQTISCGALPMMRHAHER